MHSSSTKTKLLNHTIPTYLGYEITHKGKYSRTSLF